jgi:autotransporter-associated beta strand protein
MTGAIGQNVNISGSGEIQLSGNTINGTPNLGILVDNANSFTLSIAAGLKVGGNQTWMNNSSNLLTIAAVNVNNKQLSVDGTGNTLFSGVVSGNGSLTKNGSGTLTLTAANTFSGTILVNAGIMQFAKEVSLYNNNTANWTAANLTVASGGTAAFNVGGTGEFTSGDIDILKALGTNTGGFQSGSFLGLDTTNAVAGTFTYNSNIANPNGGLNALGLAKLGTGTLVLTGTNSYTGVTKVSAGVLNIQSATALGATSSGTTVASGATLAIQNNITVGAEALTISGTGAAGQNGALVSVSGTNNYGGLVTLGAASTISSDSGTLNLTNLGTMTGAGSGLTLTGSGDGTIASIIGTGTGTLTKNGSGTWTLSGNNTFSGNVTVNNGTLVAATAAGSALANNTNITVNAGGILQLGASDQINNTAALTLAGGTFAKGNFHEGTTGAVGLGALNLTASGSHLDFGSGLVGVLTFASFNPGGNTLIIDNWTGTASTIGSVLTDRLIFNSDQTTNLALFQFTGFNLGGVQFALGGGFFEITPAPEIDPGVVTAIVCATAAMASVMRTRMDRRRSGRRQAQPCV